MFGWAWALGSEQAQGGWADGMAAAAAAAAVAQPTQLTEGRRAGSKLPCRRLRVTTLVLVQQACLRASHESEQERETHGALDVLSAGAQSASVSLINRF